MFKLPTIITEETKIYKSNPEMCAPYLGRNYISYSDVNGWTEYHEDYIKKRFAGVRIPGGVYARFGNFVGEYVETGVIPETREVYGGIENLSKIDRKEGAEYEKFVILDMSEFVLVGYIDIFYEEDNKTIITDVKTGSKPDKYKSNYYIQLLLYAHALERSGIKVDKITVFFVKREGSHLRPPLSVSSHMEEFELEYNEKRVKEALDRVRTVANEISEYYKVYEKYLK